MKRILFISAILIGSHFANAQDGWLKFPVNKSDSTKAQPVKLDYSAKKGKVTLHQDARLEKLNDFVRSGEESVEGVKIDGYRIVIFFDQDKSVVSQQRANFLARYSDHSAYVDYMAPNYRVRVGNFRTRLDAEALKADLLVYFPTAVVVEDKIQLPNIP
ncbi:MAG: hypothetical protein GQ574_03290 [Crocinitomix sp.]|nr:hypothetical protein [Crocinitomix sp.]